jgi:hypothetical protein
MGQHLVGFNVVLKIVRAKAKLPTVCLVECSAKRKKEKQNTTTCFAFLVLFASFSV